MLNGLDVVLTNVDDKVALAKASLDYLINRFGGDHGFYLEYEETTSTLRNLASKGDVEEMLEQDMRIFAQYAIDHPTDENSIMIAPEVGEVQKLTARKSVRRDMTKEVLIFPLSAGDLAMGAVYIGGKKKGTINFSEATKQNIDSVGKLLGRIVSLRRELQRVKRQNRALQDEVKQVSTFDMLVGNGEAIDRVRRALALVVDTDIPVSFIGEPGTGKGMAAEALHHESHRKAGPLVQLPLADLPEDMLGAFLFGNPAGKGKGKAKKGALRDAKGGTLILEHIDRLPLNVQAKLVKALDEGNATPIGDDGPEYEVDVRLVALLEANPRVLHDEKAINDDLYRKLGIFPLLMPPLKDRLDDLPLLVEHYVGVAADAYGKKIGGVSSETYDFLGTWSWEKNLDELELEMRRAVLRTPNGTNLGPTALSPHLIGKKQDPVLDTEEGTLKQRVARVEKRMIIDALERNNHNQSATADQLGLSRQALINKLHRYGIETGRAYKRMMREIAARAEEGEA